jgi:hypothetical protein
MLVKRGSKSMETLLEKSGYIFAGFFEIFPSSYLKKVCPKDYFKKVDELIKISCTKFRNISIPSDAFEFSVKWKDLPVNYKIKPEKTLRETLIALVRERIKFTKVKRLIKDVKIPRASFYRFLNGEHISIKNFLKLLECLNITSEIDEEQLSIVAGNKIIERSKKRLKELINSITKKRVEEKLHWYNTRNVLLKVPNKLWKRITEIIKLKYLNYALFCKTAKISCSLFGKWYRNKYKAIREEIMKKILNALSIPPESLKDDKIIPINSKGKLLKKFLSRFKPIVNDIQKLYRNLKLNQETYQK